jgi:hypothetical protein
MLATLAREMLDSGITGEEMDRMADDLSKYCAGCIKIMQSTNERFVIRTGAWLIPCSEYLFRGKGSRLEKFILYGSQIECERARARFERGIKKTKKIINEYNV